MICCSPTAAAALWPQAEAVSMQRRRSSPPLALAFAFTRLLRLYKRVEWTPHHQQHYRSVHHAVVWPTMCWAPVSASRHARLHRHYAARSSPPAAAASSAGRKKAAAAATVKMAEAWEQREDRRTGRVARAQHQPIVPAAAAVSTVAVQSDETEAAPEEEEEEDDADDPEWEKVRAALDSEGVYVTQDGAELLSMAEVERRLSSGELDGEQKTENDEDEDDDEDDDEDEQEAEEEAAEKEDDDWDDEEDWDEEDAGPAQPPSRSARRDSGSSPPAQVMWIRERADGSVSVRPWPLSDDGDEAASSLDSSYALNMPTPRLSAASAVIGSSVGGDSVLLQSVVALDERELSEHFTKGGGRGGQKVNKSSNCVHLLHRPTGTAVRCHATRSLADNRRIARDIMTRRLEELLLGPASRNQQRRSKIRKSKAKSRRRRAIKYDENSEGGEDSETKDSRAATEPAAGTALLAAAALVVPRASTSSPAEQRVMKATALSSNKAL